MTILTRITNVTMLNALKSGDCIDVGKYYQGAGTYLIPTAIFHMDRDYCDAQRERWIMSIAVKKDTLQIFASTSCRYYLDDAYETIWLR